MLRETQHSDNRRQSNWQKYIIFTITLISLLFAHPGTRSAYAHTQAIKYPRQIQIHRTRTASDRPVFVEKNITFRLQQVASGVSVSSDLLHIGNRPEQASQLTIDLTNPDVQLGVVQAHNRLFSHDEPISSMANRTHAVAGINADFFEIYGTGDPIGMLEINHRVIQSPNTHAVLGVTSTGKLSIADESFSGMVTDGNASHMLSSINRYGDVKGNHLAFFTPDLGSSLTFNGDTVAHLRAVKGTNNTYAVQSIQTHGKSLPALSGEDALVGSNSSAIWLASNVHIGDTITLSEQITPDNTLVNAVGGGTILVKNGAYFNDPHNLTPQAKNIRNPITAIGITRDGNRAFMVVIDGREAGHNKSRGVTQTEMAGYLIAHGAYQAIMFDGGGSSEMVARHPGRSQVSVINTPSDGRERPVANGLFVYSIKPASTSATRVVDRMKRVSTAAIKVVVNNGQPLTMLMNTTIPLPCNALDAQGKPATSAIKVSVYPPGLASVSNGTITAERTGTGFLFVRSGNARVLEPLTIVDSLPTPTVAPGNSDPTSAQTRRLQVMGHRKISQRESQFPPYPDRHALQVSKFIILLTQGKTSVNH